MKKKKEYCCETMEQQLTNVCEQHGLHCPDNVIRRYNFNKQYGIAHSDGSYYKIEYCPWFGDKLK